MVLLLVGTYTSTIEAKANHFDSDDRGFQGPAVDFIFLRVSSEFERLSPFSNLG